MKSGKDGEYYYVELSKEELEKLKELTLKKIAEKRRDWEKSLEC